MREARRRAGPAVPLHLVGYSNGGALAVKVVAAVAGLPPIITFQSVVDFTVSVPAPITGLLPAAPHSHTTTVIGSTGSESAEVAERATTAGEDFGIHLGAIAVRGERGLLITSQDALTRLLSNPFFPYVLERIDEGIAATGAATIP